MLLIRKIHSYFFAFAYVSVYVLFKERSLRFDTQSNSVRRSELSLGPLTPEGHKEFLGPPMIAMQN